MSPPSCDNCPVRIFIVVVFPAPEGPRKAKNFASMNYKVKDYLKQDYY